MLYRTMPKNGDRLSILGFGCMRLPAKEGKIDESRATRQIRHAVDQGVNYSRHGMAVPRGGKRNPPWPGRFATATASE